jgi:radical SAM superfamily enzyme YgiQ (UPF0313 family)
LDKEITLQITLEAAKDEEFLKSAEKANVVNVLVGYETLSQNNLNSVNKYHNKINEYKKLTKRFHNHGIKISASFVYGFDDDTPDVFDKVLEFIEENNIAYLLHSILTPYPNTPLYNELKDSGRLLTEDWELYDRQHAVFIPKKMTPEQLEEGYWRIKKIRSEWRFD